MQDHGTKPATSILLVLCMSGVFCLGRSNDSLGPVSALGNPGFVVLESHCHLSPFCSGSALAAKGSLFQGLFMLKHPLCGGEKLVALRSQKHEGS